MWDIELCVCVFERFWGPQSYLVNSIHKLAVCIPEEHLRSNLCISFISPPVVVPPLPPSLDVVALALAGGCQEQHWCILLQLPIPHQHAVPRRWEDGWVSLEKMSSLRNLLMTYTDVSLSATTHYEHEMKFNVCDTPPPATLSQTLNPD